MHHVFVYGTLKRGFVNHDPILLSPCFVGEARSVIAYPMMVAGPWYSPVVFDEPGTGHPIHGELYRVNDTTLAELDRIEGVNRTGGYRRILIAIEILGEKLDAWCYVKDRVDVAIIHDGPLQNYEDARYVPRNLRS